MRLSRFIIDTHMKLFFVGATHADQSRVREQIHATLKTPLGLKSSVPWQLNITSAMEMIIIFTSIDVYVCEKNKIVIIET
jgi:hypothetical protein